MSTNNMLSLVKGGNKSKAGIKQEEEEWMESRIQLQAIYTCVEQLPSHNRESAQLPTLAAGVDTLNCRSCLTYAPTDHSTRCFK